MLFKAALKGDPGAAGLPGIPGKDGHPGPRGRPGARGMDGVPGVSAPHISFTYKSFHILTNMLRLVYFLLVSGF